jgi:phosphohistidine phosphatase
MIRLYLLRHAKASRDDPKLADFDRPLAERGKRDAKALARWFETSATLPDLILCSPSLRTRQTLDALLPILGARMPVYDPRIYDASASDLVEIVATLPPGAASALLIGHNPGIQTLALLLSGSGETGLLVGLAEKYPTGTLAILSTRLRHWSEARAGTFHLVNFIRPADLPDT